MKNRFLGSLLAAALLVFHLPCAAEDIDLFIKPAAVSTDLPNVLIVLDNTANWNTAFVNEIAALVSTVNGLPVNADGSGKFRVGLMLFTESGSGNSNSDGGYVRAAVRELNSTNKTKYMSLLSSFDVGNDKSNGGKLGKTMTEAYRYFAGVAPYAGNGKVKTDYTGNTSGTTDSNAIYALPGNALTAKAGTSYLSPILSGSCAKNFIIYISNGAVQDNTSDTTAATTELSNAASAVGISGATTAIAISPSGSQDNVGDEWARFMNKSSLGVVTYTVDVNKVTTGQGPGWSALLKSMASVSNGQYFDVSSGNGGAQISDALNDIFSSIQSVNSVFASVSLPVSVNTQGTYLNQVFIGMFRPDATALPRWTGNLKQYRLGLIDNTLKTLDAGTSDTLTDGTSAIDSGTGFITACARSYWTPTTLDTYWENSAKGDCITKPDSNKSNYPDGNIVEKGAQAYKLRSTTTRTLKTCSATFASCTALTDFDNTNVTQTMLGAASTTERDTLIDWEKGLNVAGELDKSTTVMRPSAHGDVVHSRPAAINFGTDISPQVVVFYGGNDGVLRAVNGNRSTAIGSVPAGSELWAFVAPEFYPQIKRVYDNSTQINFFGNPTTSPTPLPKPYGFDGPITAYKDASHTWIYAAMRRGGRALYAFDFTTLSTPTLKWKIGCPNQSDDTDCTDGFTGIGQAWSSPKPLKVSGYGSGASPLLIMGGGYDRCEDTDPNTCTDSSKGKHIYVFDANSGGGGGVSGKQPLKTFDTDRPVVGDVFVINDNTGLAKWAYAVDMGGNIYRISGVDANTPFASTAPSGWKITKVASLGCSTPASCTANRKFMFAPDIVEDNGAYVLLLGSGDREKPLTGYTSAYGVSNYFFMVKDKPTVSGWLSSENTGNGQCGADVICLNSLLSIATDAANPTQASLDEKKGWYLGLGTGEQVVTSAITVFGVTTFSTHSPVVPAEGTCTSTLGTAKVYNILYSNAASANGPYSRSEVIAGGGLPPSPVAGMVKLDSGETVPFVIGASPASSLESKQPSSTTLSTQPKGRAYWFIQN